MKTEALDYYLPEHAIAQQSVEPRDASKLLACDTKTGRHHEMVFRDIISLLQAGDILVCNNTKVFRARLYGVVHDRVVEVLLVRTSKEGWLCLGKPAKRLAVGAVVLFPNGVHGEVVERHEQGQFVMNFYRDAVLLDRDAVVAFADEIGEIPLPPYVTEGPRDIQKYQTVYAKHVGSVAAPTAGFHFTERLREELRGKGVEFLEVTLHVGIGTFQTIKTDSVDEHEMHREMVIIADDVARKIYDAKLSGRRIIAVGTTTTRALEGASDSLLRGDGWMGDVNMYIRPGYSFRIIDGLVTNFHLPKSTLMLLVSALIQEKTRKEGLAQLKELYEYAIAHGYRFYSFGDAMFIY